MAQHLDKLGDFLALILRVARGDRVFDAMTDMIAQDLVLHFFERGFHRLDLVEHVDAITVIGDHPRNAANLSLDAAEPHRRRLLDFVSHPIFYIYP